MSERNPQVKRPTENCARTKYSRDQLKRLFAVSGTPVLSLDLAASAAVLTGNPSPPVFPQDAAFTHALGQNISSRKPPPKRERQVPEWYTEQHKPEESVKQDKKSCDSSKKQPQATSPPKSPEPKRILVIDRSKIKNLPEQYRHIEFEEDYSQIDRELEDKFREEAAESTPDVLGPVRYIPSFLDEQAKQGNPFASVIIENSTFDNTGALCPIPYSKPYEKVWHYKDPQARVQGPFSSIQMFNWMGAGYFKNELEIAHSNTTCFAPLYMYVMQTKRSQQDNEEHATSTLKVMLGIQAPSK